MTPHARRRRARHAAEHRHYVRRILERYDAADDATRAAGAAWYDGARLEAERIAALAPAGVGPVRAAGVIAALSPRTRWAENLQAAEESAGAAARVAGAERALWGPLAIEGAVFGATGWYGLDDPRRKAAAILEGRAPLDVLGGPKVRAFFRNICGDRRAVTIDVWAARAAAGRWHNSISPYLYRRLERAYVDAADRRGVDPRALQAAVWIDIRGGAA
jgi:hypothetical protein